MDNKQLTKLVSYFTMGDGGVYERGNYHYFVMNMKKENSDYVQWVAEVLATLTKVTVKEQPDYNKDGYVRKPLLRLETKPHPVYSKMRERVYVDKYKSIDPHALKLLDYEALAILYMCDGSLYVDSPEKSNKGLVNPSYSVSLNMKRLSYGDQLVLKKALKEKLDLEWNINKHGKYYYLRLRCKDVPKFMEGIAPYILPSFYYKLVRTESPAKAGGDIVCSTQECVEAFGNEQPRESGNK